ncbi:CBS-domain-containing membrane protein [Azospirillum agricola]|uniref:CBS domain-containing protein n=1 Tax=Azospirillum agricola TaxID=1720247 RepID=UPI001AE97D9D|nr:CBS domain-containing protein [Azospirillum agricola]MBP2227839.1 CBS-domain-containing membrane protein [Azospirillum agricola]
MKVLDVMTSPVLTVGPGASVEEAVALMIGKRISGIPVVEADGRLAGIVTEGDFLRRVECGTERQRPRWLEFLVGPGKIADEYIHTHGRRVEDVMTRKVVTVDEDADLGAAVALMEEHRVKRLPVLRDGRIVGVVSRSDLLRTLARPAIAAAANGGDARIREGFLAELGAQRWAPSSALVVTVTDGVVDLRGVVFDDRQRRALRVMAEAIPGVRRVEDRLVWVEPNSGVVLGGPEDEATEKAGEKTGA